MTNDQFKKELEGRTLAFSVRLFNYLSTLPNKKVSWLIIDLKVCREMVIGRVNSPLYPWPFHFRTLELSNFRTSQRNSCTALSNV